MARAAAEAAINFPVLTTADYCDRNAETWPDWEALVDSHTRLTWAQVSQHSDRLARALLGLGLSPGDTLLVQLYNCVELYLVRLACEKAGLHPVTAAAAFRRAELEPILRLTDPAAAIIPWRFRGFDHVALLDELRLGPGHLRRVIVVGPDAPPGTLPFWDVARGGGARGVDLRRTRFRPTDFSQIATTSGSTGVPKCAAVTIGGRMLTGLVQIHRYRITREDTIAAMTPLITGTPDALAYHGVPQIGARVVLLEHFSDQEATALIEREQVTVLAVVPTLLTRLRQADPEGRAVRSLRVLINHGALLPPSLAEAFEAGQRARIVQAYGTADFGGIASTTFDDPPEVRLRTVGRPNDGNEVRLVDEQGQDVAPGDTGRVLVRGLHGIAGYYGDPVLTQEVWRDGYCEVGDLARLDPAGNLILMGRARELIIRGGQNIFPGEVEAHLAHHPQVAEVAVVPYPDPVYGERVCACIVPRPGAMLRLEEIGTFLRAHGLAAFKLPERLELWDALPRVPAGQKVDKKRLTEEVTRRAGGSPAADPA